MGPNRLLVGQAVTLAAAMALTMTSRHEEIVIGPDATFRGNPYSGNLRRLGPPKPKRKRKFKGSKGAKKAHRRR